MMALGGQHGPGRTPPRKPGLARPAGSGPATGALASPEPLLDAAGIAVQSAERMRLATVPLVLPAAHELPEGVLMAPGGQEAASAEKAQGLTRTGPRTFCRRCRQKVISLFFSSAENSSAGPRSARKKIALQEQQNEQTP